MHSRPNHPGLRATIAVALLITALAGCGGAEGRKARHMAKGQSYLAQGNVEKARIEFRNALQIAPNDSEARFENGVVDEKLGRIREAAQYYQGAIDANADHVRARAALGRLYIFGGAPERALETIKPGLEKHPDDPSLLTVRAAALIRQKKLPEAQQDAERAVRLAPSSEDATEVLAGLYTMQGDTAKAKALLAEAIQRLPSSVDLRLSLAQLDASLGQIPEVESLLVELIKLQPSDKAHRLRLAQFYARTDKVDEAERVLREGVKTLPAERDLKTALVDLLAARRSRDVAEKELNGFIAADPSDYELRFVQARFYEAGKQNDKAQAVYEEVIAKAGLEDPGLVARNRLAALRVQANDMAGAEKLITEVLAKSPRDDDALLLRGNLALAKKDPHTAIADLRSVLRDQPNAVGVMRVLARAHLMNGEPALAEETMRRAVEANPNDAGAVLDFTQLLAQLGKNDQAKPLIEGLVKQRPTDLQALETEFRIEMATKDLVTAQSAADAIVASDPKNALGYFLQGQVAELNRHPEDALRLYDAALERAHEAAEPMAGVVRILAAEKRQPEALKRLDDLIARDPKSPLAANIKGELLLSMQRAADAVAAFKLAIERRPTWWIPYHNLAVAEEREHDAAAAIATLQQGIQAGGASEPLVSQLAQTFEKSGKADSAIRVYEDFIKRNPGSDVASNNLAMLLVTYRSDPQSLERAKQLAARFAGSPNPDFLDTYGWVLYKRGEAGAAVTALQTATSKANDMPVTLYHLGMAQMLAGQPEAARNSLTRSLQSGKPFPGMEEAKATLDKLGKGTVAGAPAKS